MQKVTDTDIAYVPFFSKAKHSLELYTYKVRTSKPRARCGVCMCTTYTFIYTSFIRAKETHVLCITDESEGKTGGIRKENSYTVLELAGKTRLCAHLKW